MKTTHEPTAIPKVVICGNKTHTGGRSRFMTLENSLYKIYNLNGYKKETEHFQTYTVHAYDNYIMKR